MHMADALISPAVGGTLWLAAAGLIGYSSRKVAQEADDRKVPLMGVLAAFIFAAQMINFTIPGTGSSGHLGGGMILAILLGPYAAFLAMASVLIVQALFFADGGLLALGCNMVNLGFFPCFIAYPLVYRRIVGAHPTQAKIFIGAVLAAVVGLELGALSVVLQTFFSGIAELPFRSFAFFMLPIHLVIGMVEGALTAAVVTFAWKARPEILGVSIRPSRLSMEKILIIFLGAAILVGVVLSRFASTQPDGLEWAISQTSEKSVHEAGQ
jgi:cobalt/nickel transport system permease protein